MMQILKDLHKLGMTIVVVTHESGVARPGCSHDGNKFSLFDIEIDTFKYMESII